MFEIRTLGTESQERIYRSFMEAFADYSVPVTWSFEEFRASNIRRGLDTAVCFGAFEGDRLVGFILNGRGTWDGLPAAYDAGTGVVPEARGSGLSGRLAERALATLPSLGIRRYILEVIRENLPAFKTYSKAGFRVTRSLECPSGSFADTGKVSPEGLSILELPEAGMFSRAEAARRRDWEPSWQNSDDSILRTPEDLVLLEARLEGAAVGHLVSAKNGTIWQLAVDRGVRARGIGTALLRELAARTGPSMRYINVQADDAATLGLLASCGVPKGVGQYEMLHDLESS